MTTVLVIETKEGVTFASDTRVSGWHVNDGWVDKIVSNGHVTFAAAGYLRAIQVMAYAKLATPPDSKEPKVIDRYVSLELVPGIIQAFKDSEDKDTLKGSVIIAAVRGRVYQISGDGAWTRSKRGLYAVGSGGDYALGALEAGATPKQAIKIASRYDAGTNSDVRVISLQNDEEALEV